MKYFTGINNLDELKSAYRKLAMRYHPDRGGDTATMQAINAEYEQLFQMLKNQHNQKAAADETGRTSTVNESPEDFINIISALLRMDGIIVELCGRWLWISGDTKKHKDGLKAAGCRWCSNKKLWSWHYPEDATKRSRKKVSMDYIRDKYGSQTFTGKRDPEGSLT